MQRLKPDKGSCLRSQPRQALSPVRFAGIIQVLAEGGSSLTTSQEGFVMHRLLWLGVLGMCSSPLCLAQEPPAAPATTAAAHSIVIRARTLIDGTSAQPRANQEILITGDRITAVYAAGTRPTPAGAEVIDLGSATVLPGLIDCHTHIFLQGEVPAAGGYDVQLLKFPASYRVARAVVAARRALEQGFTTIRD